MSLRMGELFAGYGGLGLGVASVLDVETAWVSDVCKFDKDGNAGHYEPHRGPCAVLAHRFPGVPNLGDVTKVDWSQVEPVDVLTGGSPCQDLSHAGKRAGMTDGTRSNLWVAMREAIATLRPSLVVWENVRGAYSAEADSELVRDSRLLADTRRRDGEPVLRALGRVLGDLSELGYDAVWHGLRAADVGAPHGRFRVFVVAYAGGIRRGEGWPAVAGETARGWAPANPAGRGDAHVRCLPTPTTRDHKDHTIRREPHRPDDVDTLARALTDVPAALLQTPSVADALGGHERRGGARGGELLLNGQAKELASGDTQWTDEDAPNYVPFYRLAADERWGDYAATIARWERALGRTAPAPTMTSTKGNPQLSPAFTEWLMGLPAGWITDVPGMTRNDALKLCGNGVVPQQAAAAIRWALAHIQEAAA